MKKRDGTAKLLMGCRVATTEFSTKLQLLGPTTAYDIKYTKRRCEYISLMKDFRKIMKQTRLER